jgi:hypothetical protein
MSSGFRDGQLRFEMLIMEQDLGTDANPQLENLQGSRAESQ